MKKRVVNLIVMALVGVQCYCNEGPGAEVKKNPGVDLNCQDVPIFYTGNPLEGLNAFAVVLTCCSEINKKIAVMIEKELGSIGAIIKAKEEEMNGFGAGSILNIQVGRVSKWDGGELPISRVTLNIETGVVITKTNVKSMPRVWSINDFIDSPIDSKSENKLFGAVEKLLKEFATNYKFANPNLKPTFYMIGYKPA